MWRLKLIVEALIQSVSEELNSEILMWLAAAIREQRIDAFSERWNAAVVNNEINGVWYRVHIHKHPVEIADQAEWKRVPRR